MLVPTLHECTLVLDVEPSQVQHARARPQVWQFGLARLVWRGLDGLLEVQVDPWPLQFEGEDAFERRMVSDLRSQVSGSRAA